MKTRKLLKGCAVGALLASTAAYAGYKSTYYVGVDTTLREAYGSFGSARSSADNLQYIGCSVQGYNSGTSRVFCEARTASNVTAYCTSTAAAMVTAATAQSGDSYIYFTWDDTGTCTYLYVSNTSNWAPRQP